MPASKEIKSIADINIGILGGGQLARMLTLRGFELGLEVHVFSEHSSDPAAQVTRYWHQGKFDSKADVKAFLKDVNVATFESEFADAEMLEEISKETGIKIFPQPSLMGKIQDRLTQKELLLSNKLATAEFVKVDSMEELRSAFENFGPLVLKKRRFGYDGNGTFFVKDSKALEKQVELFSGDDAKHGFIAEKMVKFKRELACIFVRSMDGSIAELPFVETCQEDNRCLWVKGPMKPNPRLHRVSTSIRKFLNTTNYIGAMGVEFFDTDYDILINELAPRVHNSGHYSMDALTEDQFSLHMKAIAGIRVSSPRTLSQGFAMYNLLGSGNEIPEWNDIPDGVCFHWYGKKENRKGRKMGHINALATSPDAALTTLKIARRKFEV